MKQVTAVIPVKANSSRLPGKNILPFAGSTLLEHKILQLQKSGVENIIVSSDSDEMLEKAMRLGVTAIKRPEDLANESRPLSDFFSYISDLIETEHMMWACATSPLFNSTLMREAYTAYSEAIQNGYDSLVTVTPFQHYIMDEKGPVNYKLGLEHSNSQELPNWRLFTNGVLFTPIDNLQKWKYNYGPNCFQFEIKQQFSIDIDTPVDYEIAKILYEKWGQI